MNICLYRGTSCDRVWPEKIKSVYQNGHEMKQRVILLVKEGTMYVYDLKMIIWK